MMLSPLAQNWMLFVFGALWSCDCATITANSIGKRSLMRRDDSEGKHSPDTALLRLRPRRHDPYSHDREKENLKLGHMLTKTEHTDLKHTFRFQSDNLDRTLQSLAGQMEPNATRDLLKSLRVCASCAHFERLGDAHDGGYVTCLHGFDKGLVSALDYGVNGVDGWGLAVTERFKIPLHEYDCTNPTVPTPCENCNVRFHDECILNHQGAPQDKYKTMTDQLQEIGNGNAADGSLLLKMDVEGAEWAILVEEPVENMRKFREVIIELRWIRKVAQHSLYLRAVKKLLNVGFAVAHLHGNNNRPSVVFGTYQIPDVIEATFVQKADQACTANLPYHLQGLDQPNDPKKQELGDAVLPSDS